MEHRSLGRSGLTVSAIGLGTMTWGRQNTEAEGHAQMDVALERGVTFWDTAEMYAIPPNAETYGKTETIIGNWFAARGGRDRVVLASKVSGPGMAYVRDGNPHLDRKNITAAVEASLKRLRTDYIDLYQLHWPDRAGARFGQRGFVHDPAQDGATLEETLATLDDLVKAGKIRAAGVSNETPWGVMSYLALSADRGYTRIASVQNAYNLLNRTYEFGLAEVSMREEVGLLAYAPLAAGTLTGKYLDGAVPAGSRRAIDPRKSRYDRPNVDAAVRAYHAVAKKHGLSPVQMALAFVTQQPFTASNLIGATTVDDLIHSIDSAELVLSQEVLADIDAVYAQYPDPCP